MGTNTAHSPIPDPDDDQSPDRTQDERRHESEERSGPERRIEDKVTYAVSDLFCSTPVLSTREIAVRIKENYGREISREGVYPRSRAGRARGYFVMRPPPHLWFQSEIARRFGFNPAWVDVVDSGPTEPLKEMANTAAEQIELTIRSLAKNKKTVHLGLDSGGMNRLVSEALGRLLAYDPIPSLMLHLLSPGHPLEQPGTTPTSLVEFYRHSADHVDHIDFHSQPWASAEELERIKRSALHAREAFEQASQIDVIATSIASPADPHCRLRRLLEKLDPESIPRLDARGWRGDVHYHPYNADGAIIGEPEKLPVSLVGIPDLVQIAANPSGKRHVFMVVPPCADCGRLRADALKPLLVNRSLRVFNHLVTDVKTAQKVLA